MSNIMKKWINENCWLLLGSAIVLCFFGYLVFTGSTFIFEGDILTENLRLYIDSWERIREGSLPLWTWSNFLGANYFGQMTYYGIASPFFWIIMASPTVEMIIDFVLLSNALKSLTCFVCGYIWLNKGFKNQQGAFVGGLVMCFSGFVMTNYNNSLMLDAICFMPLVLYYTEIFLEKKKGIGLAISVALVGMGNYYFLYLFLPFVFFYVLMRYIVLNGWHWKTLWKDALKYLGWVFLGIGLCAFVLIPSFMMLKDNPRFSSFPSLFTTISKLDWYRFFTGFINPINDWRINNNYFISTEVDWGIGYSGGMAVYNFIISPLAMGLLVLMKNRKEKFGLLSLYVLYLVFTGLPFFYYLFNQSYESRWLLNLMFLNSATIATVFSYKEEYSAKKIVPAVIGIIAFILGCLLVTRHYSFTDLIGWKIIKRNSGILSLFLIGYGIFFLLKGKVAKVLLVVLVFFEVVLSGYNLFYNEGNKLAPMKKTDINVDSLVESESIDWIKENDSDFYRISYDQIGSLQENNAVSMNYLGFTGYCSLYNFNQQDFTTNRFKLNYNWFFRNQNGKMMLKNILSNRYWIQTDENSSVPYGYEEVFRTEKEGVYKNSYPLSVAWGMDLSMSKEQYESYPIALQDYLLLNNVVLDEDGHQGNEKLDVEALVENGLKKIEIEISGKETGYVVVDSKGSPTVGYTIYDKNNEILSYDFFTTDLGYSTIPMVKNGVLLIVVTESGASLYYDNLSWMEDWYGSIADEMLQEVHYTDNSLEGTITLNSDKWVATSIPYDLGWKALVDGEEVEITKINGGFVGIYLKAGEHQLKFSYMSPGLLLGFGISFICLAVLLIFGLNLVTILSKRRDNS